MVEDNRFTDSAAAFLEKRGGVELLCEIDPSGSRFDRLTKELEISRSTVSRRLQTAEELGLLKRIPTKGEGTKHRYRLTEKGAELRVFLNQRGATEKYRQIKHLRKELRTDIVALQGSIEEKEGSPPIPRDQNVQQLLQVDR